MSDVSFSSDVSFNRYLFEYRHDGSDWGIEIHARSPEEARERLKALMFARYQGEIKHSFTIPTGGSIIDRIRRLMRSLF